MQMMGRGLVGAAIGVFALLAIGRITRPWWSGESSGSKTGGSGRELPVGSEEAHRIVAGAGANKGANAGRNAVSGTLDAVVEASPTEGLVQIRIHGRVASEWGQPIPGATVVLEFSNREDPMETTALRDGSYEFLFDDPVVLADRSPIGLRATAPGFVEETSSLWTDRSGFLIEGNIRNVDLQLRVAQELVLLCMFDDGTPVADASIDLLPTKGTGSWLVLGTEPQASGLTEDDGAVRFAGMPARGVYRAVVNLPGLPTWYEVAVDLRVDQPRTLLVPAPCTLAVALDAACLELGGEECSPTHVRVLVDGGVPGDIHDASGYYKLDEGGVCSVPGLRTGESVELRLLCRRGAYHRLIEGLRIAERNQTFGFDCRGVSLITEDVLPLAGVQRPLQVKWRLIDGVGLPITNQQLGSLDLSGFQCTWQAGPDSGRFGIYCQDHNPRAEVFGYLELPIQAPVKLAIAGYGTMQETLVEEELQLVDIQLDLDALNASAATVHFDGVTLDQEQVGVLTVKLTHRETGYAYRALRRTLKSSTRLELSLPVGTYDYQATSMANETALGQFEVEGLADQAVLVEFKGHGSVQGRAVSAADIRELMFVPRGEAGPAASGVHTVRPFADGRFLLLNVVAGDYSVVARVRHGGGEILQAVAKPLRVVPNEVSDAGTWLVELDVPGVKPLRLDGPGKALVDVWGGGSRRYRGWLLPEDRLALSPSEREPKVFLIEHEASWRGLVECEQVVEGSERVIIIPRRR